MVHPLCSWEQHQAFFGADQPSSRPSWQSYSLREGAVGGGSEDVGARQALPSCWQHHACFSADQLVTRSDEPAEQSYRATGRAGGGGGAGLGEAEPLSEGPPSGGGSPSGPPNDGGGVGGTSTEAVAPAEVAAPPAAAAVAIAAGAGAAGARVLAAAPVAAHTATAAATARPRRRPTTKGLHLNLCAPTTDSIFAQEPKPSPTNS